MSIAIQEFKIAMENLGAKRLLDREIRFNLLVPCYEVNGVLLIHSGTDFCYSQMYTIFYESYETG